MSACDHSMTLHFLDQRSCDAVIHPTGLVSFDHITCNNCHEELHHVTFAMRCDICHRYYLCVRCHSKASQMMDKQIILSWFYDSRGMNTFIAYRSNSFQRHEKVRYILMDPKMRDPSFRYMPFDRFVVTSGIDYINYLETGEMTKTPLFGPFPV
jgi:hypothetical protein